MSTAIQGVVVNPRGGIPVSGVTVAGYSTDGYTEGSSTTDSNGWFSLSGLSNKNWLAKITSAPPDVGILLILPTNVEHIDLGSVTADQHHEGFVGLYDGAGNPILPDANDYIQVTGDVVLKANVAEAEHVLALTIDQAQIDHGSISIGADDHPEYLLLPGRTGGQAVEGDVAFTGLLLAADTELTISAGAITVTQSHHTIDTEADAATDELDTISGLTANQLYFFYPAHTDRTVVLKHNTGNILCIGNQDFSLNDAHDFVWAFSPDGSTVYVGGPHNAPVFISATEPTSKQDGQLWLDTDATGTGGLGVLNVATITSSATLTTSHTVVLCDATSGAITVTLPTAVGNDGRHYHIKKIDSSGNAVTIDGDGSETIDDGATAVIGVQYECVTVVSDGTEWWVL